MSRCYHMVHQYTDQKRYQRQNKSEINCNDRRAIGKTINQTRETTMRLKEGVSDVHYGAFGKGDVWLGGR